MSHPQLSILIPAAGGSTRLGQAKQLVEQRGKPLILNTVNRAYSIGPGEILVVTGAKAELVKKAVPKPMVRWVHNPEWCAGMGVSIAMGAAVISPESTGLMILMCDQWRIQERDLQTLVETWRSNPDQIVCAHADGINLPPVIFPSSCFTQLCGLKGKQGARSLLQTHAEILTSVPMQNAIYDLDTKAHLDEMEMWGQRQAPD